ncbi:hypothetical protein AMTR_s00046p00094180 [Amborella trichopoda]|uniref:Uncharacterized protein n=1 Tax=Amborella trichopoda TaxID=13333 RepID=U5CXB8_AMBTC|nr:hypothetical protein AMTR_s00046p00094180 [Amborella trichopoda]
MSTMVSTFKDWTTSKTKEDPQLVANDRRMMGKVECMQMAKTMYKRGDITVQVFLKSKQVFRDVENIDFFLGIKDLELRKTFLEDKTRRLL